MAKSLYIQELEDSSKQNKKKHLIYVQLKLSKQNSWPNLSYQNVISLWAYAEARPSLSWKFSYTYRD
jgi:hypothetical protein